MIESTLIAHVERTPLANAMARLAKLAPSKQTLPILGHVLLDASESGVCLTASNLETTVKITVPAQVEQPGHATIPARLLEQVVRADRSPWLTIETTGLTTTLAQSGNRPYITFTGLDPTEFPHTPTLGAQIAHVKPGALQHAVRQVLPCYDTDGIDYSIVGVYLDFQADHIAVVTAHRHRVALTEVPATVLAPTRALICLTAAQQITMLPSDDDVAVYGTNEAGGWLAFRAAETTLYTRPVGTAYPTYRAILPTEHRISGTVNRRALLESAKRVRKAADRGDPRIRIDCESNHLTLHCANRDGMAASETLDATCNEPIQFALNAKYLIDALTTLVESEKVWWGMNDPLAAIVLHEIGR